MASAADESIASEIREISVAQELGDSFLPYSLSVITSRALPDVRDGLKPVQRRIIVAMNQLGLRPGTAHKKSARVVGETMGNYHPHGDSAIYEALVRMGQNFSMSVPLVDPHGNFGSPDDPPAAARYTECRLAQSAMDMIGELDEDTVEFRDTYDAEGTEPECLPARMPNLLVNGATGIAVGMATNMPPHNLVEVVAALELVMTKRRPTPTVAELMAVLPGPDFPTGGIIVDDGGLAEAYETGRGTFRIRARAEMVKVTARRRGIVVTELPYAVGPERVMKRIKDLVLGGKLSGIADVRNLSDRRHGLRLQIEVKSGVNPEALLAQLYRLTPLEETFGLNNVVLVEGRPTTVGLYDLCRFYLEHRQDVVVRRTTYRLERARERAHIVEGLLIALDNIDLVVRIIRSSQTSDEARGELMAQLTLSEIQANHILDMRLRRLVQLEKLKLADELAELKKRIDGYEKLLGSDKRQRTAVINELREVAAAHGGERRTKIISADEIEDVSEASLGLDEPDSDAPCRITWSTSGLIGRESIDEGRTAKPGRHDVLAGEVVTAAGSTVSVITSLGRVFPVKTGDVAEVAGRSRGSTSSEMFSFIRGERVAGLIGEGPEPTLLVTAGGVAKRLAADDLNGMKAGQPVINLKDRDEVVTAFRIANEMDVLMVSSDGQALRTPSAGVSMQGRSAGGVAGMKLKSGARVVGAGPVHGSGVVLITTDGGGAKLIEVSEVPSKGRGATGVRLVKFKGFETQLQYVNVAPDRDLRVVVGSEDRPDRPDPAPRPLELAPTRRDGASVETARPILASGKARW